MYYLHYQKASTLYHAAVVLLYEKCPVAHTACIAADVRALSFHTLVSVFTQKVFLRDL
jgi:hypothetical protein